ncbi:MAG: glycoside hydrolase family 43 protein [Lachnospiraceae bacterium]|nr:glycoside hydrolase family 43 protein [Lachnospiraceae bacterium]
MKGIRIISILMLGVIIMAIAACGSKGKEEKDILKGNQTLGVSVHDPSLKYSDGTYYLFGTHMSAAKGENLTAFKSFADGTKPGNPLFKGLFDDLENGAFAFTGKFNDKEWAVWAPDVIYNENLGKWVMYFATSHDYRTSSICMATSDNIEGPYEFQKILVSSGFTRLTAEKTNIYEVLGEDANISVYLEGGEYNNLKYPNCIDPALFHSSEGKLYMAYGSWSGGIFMYEMDETTGLPIYPSKEEAENDKSVDAYFGKRVAGGLHNSCEGPYVYYNEGTGYYYLLVSYGELTNEGGYQIREFRSKEPMGPYTDAKGEELKMVADHSQYGVKMAGNYSFPSLKKGYMAPGHCSVFENEDGKIYICYHQRFEGSGEYHEPRVHEMFITEDGWLTMLPFATTEEEVLLTDIKEGDLTGTYYMVNHGLDISSDMHSAVKTELKKGGSVASKEASGNWSVQGNTVSITLSDVTYKGIAADMKDEAGNEVRCLSLVGANNETLWLVMYK